MAEHSQALGVGGATPKPGLGKAVQGASPIVPGASPSNGFDDPLQVFPLTEQEFQWVAKIMYQAVGIHLKDGKQNLVRARLGRRTRSLGCRSFSEYLSLVEADASGGELQVMVDLLTTNKTEFFRDAVHFDFIRERILRPRKEQKKWRFWSAGCSTGQEPYSLAMLVADFFGSLQGRDVKILATDICRLVLARAADGYYEAEELEGLPPAYLQRFLKPEGQGYRVKAEIRQLVHFALLNLNGDWPMRGPFQAILCRNVMIYFDRVTRERLLERFYALLEDGGYLFVGLSESLTGLRHPYTYIRPAVYQKCTRQSVGLAK